MISSVFHMIVYKPLYNALIVLVDTVPWHDVGLAVIALTIAVKFVLYPLSLRVARTQEKTRTIAPQIEDIKKKHKGDRQGENKALLALYRENNIHPFSGILLLLVQLPILFGLYFVFAGGGLPAIHQDFLYSFVSPPGGVRMEFFGMLDMAARGSIVLAFLAGITQFFYARMVSMPEPSGEAGTFQHDIAKSFQVQIKYVLPIIVAGISYTLSAAVPLYWITSNLFMVAQEWVVRRHIAATARV